MGKNLVLVGGGHAHLTALLNLYNYIRRGHRVTLVSSSAYHYYSGMGPGMLSGIYRPQEIRFHIKKMAEDRGASFVEDRVIRIDPEKRFLLLHSGNEVQYDVISFNTGSDIETESISITNDNVFTVKPIVNLLKARNIIIDQLKMKIVNIVVVGGGPAGVEIAGNLWRLVRDSEGQAKISLIAGNKLLDRYPHRVRRLAISSLEQRGIEIVEGMYVNTIGKGEVSLTDGRSLPYDVTFLASGIRPSSLFRNSGLPTGEDGGLLVNSHLQSVAYQEIFGGGDCIYFGDQPLEKVGVYAVRQNELLYHNLMSALVNEDLNVFDPGGAYLLILNMGDSRGIFWKKSLIWYGRLAFILKDYIDRRFMKKFQVSGEPEEQFTE